ncbi:hypothetical protein [Nocardioides bizhenqiangii]|uniref:Secreted protein n=1 Tax=Nocardioides bizhenqiangii TaxID=3095076 RepID=A0ABZ0ZUW5_9ACTN|nr:MULTISPECIES: hypothetical protein [unclassified Nocardioides]MDZ5623125.1 hypothetical protein [Nocardioides sp. HM23]WQQ28100.1 hypothetical protein SHK19_07665 [Nocardioides sp. HM61]
MMYVVIGAAGVVVLLLVVWAGHRMLRNPSGTGGGTSDGMGMFIDAFDPGRARADQDLKSKDHESEVTPSADGNDRPMAIDHITMRARIKRPTPPKD